MGVFASRRPSPWRADMTDTSAQEEALRLAHEVAGSGPRIGADLIEDAIRDAYSAGAASVREAIRPMWHKASSTRRGSYVIAMAFESSAFPEATAALTGEDAPAKEEVDDD